MIFGKCFIIISAAQQQPKTKSSLLWLGARKYAAIGKIAAQIPDASETIFVVEAITAKRTSSAAVIKGISANAAPARVATPLPPRNLKKTGKI